MEANIFKTHFKEFSRIAKRNTKFTKQGKPIISRTDPDFEDTVWDDETIFSERVQENVEKDEIQPGHD